LHVPRAVEDRVPKHQLVDVGAGYVQEMLATHVAEQEARGRRVEQSTAGVHGFPVTAVLRGELEAMDLRHWTGAAVRRLDVVTSSERADASALVAGLAARGLAVQGLVCPSNGNWAESDAFGSALIPQSIIQGILGCVLESGVHAA
jgi:hypothetical protein